MQDLPQIQKTEKPAFWTTEMVFQSDEFSQLLRNLLLSLAYLSSLSKSLSTFCCFGAAALSCVAVATELYSDACLDLDRVRFKVSNAANDCVVHGRWDCFHFLVESESSHTADILAGLLMLNYWHVCILLM